MSGYKMQDLICPLCGDTLRELDERERNLSGETHIIHTHGTGRVVVRKGKPVVVTDERLVV